jgi:hypothetical protein
MKAASIHQARLRHPDLGGLLADTADSNTHMRGINDALGYRPTHRSAIYQLDLNPARPNSPSVGEDFEAVDPSALMASPDSAAAGS